MNASRESNSSKSIFGQIRRDKAAFCVAIVVLLSITFPALVLVVYGGASLAPEFLTPLIGICFILFYGLVPVGTILGLVNLGQQGVSSRLAGWALFIIALAVIICFAMYRLYD